MSTTENATLTKEDKQCPYQPDHLIRKTRFGTHLIKCRRALEQDKNHPYHYKIHTLGICKYNQHHHIHKAELEFHEKECQQNFNVAYPKSVTAVTQNISPVLKGQLREDEDEDWENDDVQPYNPQEKARRNHIMPAGLTPSQRIAFRDAQRRGELPDFMKKD